MLVVTNFRPIILYILHIYTSQHVVSLIGQVALCHSSIVTNFQVSKLSAFFICVCIYK